PPRSPLVPYTTLFRSGQLAPAAPAAARVEEIFFQRGEWAAANQPVLALLPDSEVKLVFFVPEAETARYRPGRTVRFTCDGCEAEDRKSTRLNSSHVKI